MEFNKFGVLKLLLRPWELEPCGGSEGYKNINKIFVCPCLQEIQIYPSVKLIIYSGDFYQTKCI